MSQKQQRMLRQAVAEGVDRFDPFLVLQLEPSTDLHAAVVEQARERKALLADDAQAAAVVAKAAVVLSEPVLLDACVRCALATSELNEDAILDQFGLIYKSMQGTGKGKVQSVYAAARAEKRKVRKKELRELQQRQRETRQDLLEDGCASRMQQTQPQQGQGQDQGSERQRPRTPPDETSPLPLGVVDGSTGVGGVVVARQALVLASSLASALTVVNYMKRSGGTQPLPASDAAALSLLEQLLGFEACVDSAGATQLLTLTGTTASRKSFPTQPLSIKGNVAHAMLWLILPLVSGRSSTSPARLTFTGQTDVGSMPLAAVADGYCTLLGLFQWQAKVQAVKRRGASSIVSLVCDRGGVPSAVSLTDQGTVSEVVVSVWVSSAVPLAVGQKIAQAAAAAVQKAIPEAGAPSVTKLQLWKEDAVDTDTIVLTVIMRSTTGCVWCGSSTAGRGTKAEHTAQRAASQVISDYNKGSCFSEFLQEHVALMMAVQVASTNTTSRVRIGLPATPQLVTAMKVARQCAPAVTFDMISPALKAGKHSAILECTPSQAV